MFVDAFEKASKFTRPLIVSTRTYDGVVTSEVGSFIVINRDGWCITAAHVFDKNLKFEEDHERLVKLQEAENRGEKVEYPPDLIVNFSIWVNWDQVRITDRIVYRDLDLAVFKLNNYDPNMISEYPKFKDPYAIKPGLSLCRIGFPFHDVVTDYDTNDNTFRIRNGVLPIPFFPNDGIFTRNISIGDSNDGIRRLFLETSTPGLRGQSGGPIFDKYGYLCGMQVHTNHMPLGFAVKMTDDKGNVSIENQVMNLGIGVHILTISQIMDRHGIKYARDSDDEGYRIIG